MNCSSDLIWYELRKFDTGLNKVIDPLHVDLGPKSFYSVGILNLKCASKEQQDKKSICMEQVVAMILSCCILN